MLLVKLMTGFVASLLRTMLWAVKMTIGFAASPLRAIRPRTCLMRAVLFCLGVVLILGGLVSKRERPGGQSYATPPPLHALHDISTTSSNWIIVSGTVLVLLRRRKRKTANEPETTAKPSLVANAIQPSNSPCLDCRGAQKHAAASHQGKSICIDCHEAKPVAICFDCRKASYQGSICPDCHGAGYQGSTGKMPSDFLRAGWCRKGLAINRHGDRLTTVQPSEDPKGPVAWSLSGAIIAAFSEARVCHEYETVLSQVLHDRYAVTDFDKWNADPRCEPEEAIALAVETERRLGINL